MAQYREMDSGDLLTDEEMQNYFVGDIAGLPEDKRDAVSFGEWLDAMLDASRFEIVDEDEVKP